MVKQRREGAIEWLWTVPGVVAVDVVDEQSTLRVCVRGDMYEVARRILERQAFEVMGFGVRLVRE